MTLEARTEVYRTEAKRLLEADRAITKAFRKDMRALVKPAGDRALNALSAAMPNRGGLSALIGSRGRVSVTAGGKGVTANLAAPGIFMSQFEKGTIRHPVYGRAPWQSQTVPAGEAGKSFEKDAADLARQASDTVVKHVRSAL